MKNLLIIIAAFTMVFGMNAQSNYMKDFGTKYHKVQNFLDGNKKVTITNELPNKICAYTSDLDLSYLFREGRLYKVIINDKAHSPGLVSQKFLNKKHSKVRHPRFADAGRHTKPNPGVPGVLLDGYQKAEIQ